jgi:hypothetical protein
MFLGDGNGIIVQMEGTIDVIIIIVIILITFFIIFVFSSTLE